MKAWPRPKSKLLRIQNSISFIARKIWFSVNDFKKKFLIFFRTTMDLVRSRIAVVAAITRVSRTTTTTTTWTSRKTTTSKMDDGRCTKLTRRNRLEMIKIGSFCPITLKPISKSLEKERRNGTKFPINKRGLTKLQWWYLLLEYYIWKQK